MLNKQDKHLHAQAIKNCEDKLSTLPPGEAKYFLFMLIKSIKDKNNAANNEFLEELSALLDCLNELHQKKSYDAEIFNQIIEHYKTLQTIAQINTYGAQLKVVLLHIGGAIAALFSGIAGGLIGGTIGLIRGTWNLEPLKGLGVGLFIGYILGATFAFRTPKKLFKDEFLRQIEFSLNGLYLALENIKQSLNADQDTLKPFEHYYEEQKAIIFQQCFANDLQAFEQFLDEDITYEIKSFKAGFIGSSSLHGYLGHHLYLVIKIKDSSFLIEFTQDPTEPDEQPEQRELRTVKGKKIIEMLATYQKLQETTPCTLRYVLTRMKPGDNDCHTLVNKVLIATNQPTTVLTRYKDMTYVGTAIGFFIDKLSPFKEDFYNAPEQLSAKC